jgi:eukaryotic-like serine/threonine-protein kinase
MERWREAESLFDATVDLPLERRAHFLGVACAGDMELLREVEDLLAADGKGEEGILAAIEREAQSLFGMEGVVGSRIGAYCIVGEIGRGGMSTVYLAVRDDDQFQKQVAIKLIRFGMDSEDVLTRFRHERQILANLEHPYIARLLDGGTAPDGRPFLVMEYLPGETLDVYCRNAGLDLRSRCRLFLKICEAVSFAHRNLVVHRDLKPGNILVDAGGSPKLLDFGVAKLLDANAGAGQTATLVAMRPMTPDYASPEQFRGDAITTAADVYSLGAILYELLSDQRPHRFSGNSLRELERVICEMEPPRPSECARLSTSPWRARIKGDLDAIVAKAMRKEPALRYPSVDRLAADLERYLGGWPVHARQGDVSYRAHKFLRRNRGAIAVCALLAATLVAGATAALVQGRRADRERLRALANQSLAEASQRDTRQEAVEAQRQRGLADEQRRQAETEKAAAETQRQLADRRFEQVHQLAGKFILDFNDAIAKLPGSTAARKMVVETGLKYLDALAPEARGNRALLEEIARGYDRLGDTQGNPLQAHLGDYPGALQSYRKAQSIRDKISDPSPAFLQDRMGGDLRLAEWMMQVRGDTAEAERLLQAAFALAHRPAAAGYELRITLAGLHEASGDLKERMGVYSGAIEPYSQALDIWSQLPKEGRDPAVERAGISVAHTKLADAYMRMEQAPQALPHLRAALAIDEPLAQADPHNLSVLRKLYVDYVVLAYTFITESGKNLGGNGEALTAFEKAAELADRMAAADANDLRPLTDIRTAQLAWGDFLRDHNQAEEALVHYRRGLEISEKQAAASPLTVSGAESLLMAHHRIARGFVVAGKPEEALEHLRQADRYLSEAKKLSPESASWIKWSYTLERARGLAYTSLKRWPEAIAAYGAEIAGLAEARKRDRNDGSILDEQRIGYTELAGGYAAAERWTEAEQAMRSALDSFEEIASHRALRADEEQARIDDLAKLTAWKRK